MKHPPTGFTSVLGATQAASGTFLDVIAVVTSVGIPTTTKNKTFSLDIVLHDESSWSNSRAADRDGFKVRVFRLEQDEMPKIKSAGDVVLIRGIKISEWRGKKDGAVADRYKTPFVVFPAERIPDPHFSAPYGSSSTLLPHSTNMPPVHLEGLEQLYVIHLKSVCTRLGMVSSSVLPGIAPTGLGSATLAPPTRGSIGLTPTTKKFSLLRDVNGSDRNNFFDLVGEVVRIFLARNGAVELYVTDYTPNSLFFNYKDKGENGDDPDGPAGDVYGYIAEKTRNWTGPLGRMTFQVTLWEPHGQAAIQKLREGSFVRLYNVRVKYNNTTACLEGGMWKDQYRPDKIDFRVIPLSSDVPEERAFFERRRSYLDLRSNGAKVVPAQGEQTRLSKKAQKKAKQQENHQKGKQQKEAEEKERQAQLTKLRDLALEAVKDPRCPELNPNIVARNPQQELLAIKTIIDGDYLDDKGPGGRERKLPFVNMKCRTAVRVVDFHPPNLEDFSRSLADPGYNTTSAPEQRWEWAFELRVEDVLAPPSADGKRPMLPLIVGSKDAEFLLRMDATNLREDEEALAALREKLFILWGDLEERKKASEKDGKRRPINPAEVSSKAFACCIKEYGEIKDKDDPKTWVRRHRIFDTTIR